MTIKEILDEFDSEWNGVDDDYRKDATKWLEQKLTELVESVPEVKKKESGNKDYCKGYMNGIIDSWKQIQAWKKQQLGKEK